MVAVVPRTCPSNSATKHPFGLASRKRLQSAAVWFQPASSFNRSPAGISVFLIVRRCIGYVPGGIVDRFFGVAAEIRRKLVVAKTEGAITKDGASTVEYNC